MALGAPPAMAATGDLIQKPGPLGCISDTGTASPDPADTNVCLDGRLSRMTDVVVSPDGRSAYSAGGGIVAVFDRDPVTGALTQKTGSAGCISATGENGCTTGRGLAPDGLAGVAVSPDGRSAYVVSMDSNTLLIFDRDPDTGVLTQRSGLEGCISDDGSGDCLDSVAPLNQPRSVTVSPDGENVYVSFSNGVATFDRSTATGVLTPITGPAGCISSTGNPSGDVPPVNACQVGQGLAPGRRGGVLSLVVAPDGSQVYAAAEDQSIAILERDQATGILSQSAGPEACVNDKDSPGPSACMTAVGLRGVQAVAVSPDGQNLYAVSRAGSTAVVIFERDPATGAWRQKAGLAGCISATGSPFGEEGNRCTVAGMLTDSPVDVAVSPDGKSVYVVLRGVTYNDPTNTYVSENSGVAIFDRDPDTGALTQKPGAAGCVTESGRTDPQDPLTQGACADGKALSEARALTVSPDSKNVYVVGPMVAIFDRVIEPDTTITSGPAQGSSTADRTPTFTFASDFPGATFECSVDGAAFAPCSSPFTTGTLAAGMHSFSVRAVGSGGGLDTTPATRTFRVIPVTAAPPSGCAAGTSAGVSCQRNASGGLTITGTAGANRIVGTTGRDVIRCGDGDDVVFGGPGDDDIRCGAGNDTVDAGTGNDLADGESGNDRLNGGPGIDRLFGGSGNDIANGGSGNDVVAGGSGNDRLSGNEGNDQLSGNSGQDRVAGNEGSDRINGGAGSDRLAGNSGADRVSGSSGNDRLSGNSGNDRLSGGSGRDRLVAGTGRDRLSGGSGSDRLNTRDRRGGDRANCGESRRDLDRASVDRGDRVRGCERVRR